MSLVYLDTSAAVKLAMSEPESDALRGWMGATEGDLLSSSLLVTEILRACHPHGPDATIAARGVIDRINFVEVDRSILEIAAYLAPAAMRTLDAIHLATALGKLPFLRALVTYDKRLAVACRDHGVSVVSPGVDL
ncbi:VapC-like toxin [Pontimonas salivibrio]|uniref:Ribonuclease VapC n=1 Tax=Pontimonas salivibrio TaxID=1159327 RepID=A0A2L2BR89_9MICO|nr:type II toxin-antitoxin system VapC family toxin [Pontimonas salivibrio]AVG24181.1 VapC-like toxin [Pontimonas salivibrio]